MGNVNRKMITQGLYKKEHKITLIVTKWVFLARNYIVYVLIYVSVFVYVCVCMFTFPLRY